MQPLALLAEIALDVLLEVEPVDDDRLLGFLLVLAACLLVVGFGIGILDNQRQPLAVGRPGVIGDRTLGLGDLLGLAAGAIEQPQLVDLLLVAASRQKGEIAAV